MEVVPDCSRLNWRVISNRLPPMKLAPVREAPGRRPRNGAPPKPRHPRQAPAPGRDTLSVPLRGGLSGNGMLPVFFAASVAPSRGVWGTKLCPFFCSFFNQKAKSEFRPCFQKLPFKLFFHQKRAGVATRQIWRMMTPPQNALNLIKAGPLPQLTRFGE